MAALLAEADGERLGAGGGGAAADSAPEGGGYEAELASLLQHGGGVYRAERVAQRAEAAAAAAAIRDAILVEVHLNPDPSPDPYPYPDPDPGPNPDPNPNPKQVHAALFAHLVRAVNTALLSALQARYRRDIGEI